ncbi:MAG TPA: hypothetical protein VJU16_00090, partial [Planctomycetota bacterium]|nr:hypothetical protein [Planctomycetota bacterium]
VAGHSWSKGLRVLELASGQVVAEFPLKPLRYTDCAFLPGGRQLISGTEDTTLAIWSLESNVAAEAGKDLETLWTDMGGGSFPAAIDALVARGDAAIAFLKDRLGAKPDEREIARILETIASKDGDARKGAVTELVEVGGDAEAPLDRAIEAERDANRREGLVQAREELLAPIVKSPATLRRLRAQAVLERIGSADARAILKSLSESAPSRRERFEASLALKRLK